MSEEGARQIISRIHDFLHPGYPERLDVILISNHQIYMFSSRRSVWKMTTLNSLLWDILVASPSLYEVWG